MRERGPSVRGVTETGDVVPGTEWAAHLFVVSRREKLSKDVSPMTTFHPPVAARVGRLRALGSSVDVPGKVRTPGQTRALALVWLVTAPCWLPVAALMAGTAVMLTGISLAIDSLFLAPMVALVHVLLRRLGG